MNLVRIFESTVRSMGERIDRHLIFKFFSVFRIGFRCLLNAIRKGRFGEILFGVGLKFGFRNSILCCKLFRYKIFVGNGSLFKINRFGKRSFLGSPLMSLFGNHLCKGSGSLVC